MSSDDDTAKDAPERDHIGPGTRDVKLAKEARLAHEAELKAENDRRDDRRALVLAVLAWLERMWARCLSALPKVIASLVVFGVLVLGAFAVYFADEVTLSLESIGLDFGAKKGDAAPGPTVLDALPTTREDTDEPEVP